MEKRPRSALADRTRAAARTGLIGLFGRDRFHTAKVNKSFFFDSCFFNSFLRLSTPAFMFLPDTQSIKTEACLPLAPEVAAQRHRTRWKVNN